MAVGITELIRRSQGGGSDPTMFEQAQAGLAELKPTLTGGLSSSEMDEAMQSILGVEKARKASTARMMTRGGGKFDPRSFARATAPLAAGTQKAIGGLKAKSAGMARAGSSEWLRLLMQLYGQRTGQVQGQQQLQMAQQQAESQRTSDIWGGVASTGLNIATLGLLSRD